jgi:hypothetical protein
MIAYKDLPKQHTQNNSIAKEVIDVVFDRCIKTEDNLNEMYPISMKEYEVIAKNTAYISTYLGSFGYVIETIMDRSRMQAEICFAVHPKEKV